MMGPPKFEKRSSYYSKSHPQYRYSSSGEEDEENTPLLYYSLTSSGSKRRQRSSMKQKNTRRRSRWCKLLTLFSFLFGIIFFSVLICLASPLKEVEVLSLNNVLGTRKNLIFDLHVKAK